MRWMILMLMSSAELSFSRLKDPAMAVPNDNELLCDCDL